MTFKEQVWRIALEQLRTDFSCTSHQLTSGRVEVVPLAPHPDQRQYHQHPYPFRAVSLPGGGVVAVEQPLVAAVQSFFRGISPSFLFELPRLLTLHQLLATQGIQLVELHHVFLPDRSNPLPPLTTDLVWYQGEELEQFRGEERFAAALAFNPKFPDQLAVVAVGETGQPLGMAAASADSPNLWQIGVDVLPGSQGSGIAIQLVSRLRQRLEQQGKLPFYGNASSHIISQRVAAAAGFSPAWVELYGQPL